MAAFGGFTGGTYSYVPPEGGTSSLDLRHKIAVARPPAKTCRPLKPSGLPPTSRSILAPDAKLPDYHPHAWPSGVGHAKTSARSNHPSVCD